MKTLRITVLLLAMTILVSATAPLASASPPFHERWWQGTFTLKGYRYTDTGGNALGDNMPTVTMKVWLYTEGSSTPSGYKIGVCAAVRPYALDNYGWEQSSITSTDLYFKDQGKAALWNFDNESRGGLTFIALPYTATGYPVLLIKARSETQGTMSTVSCTAHGFDGTQGPLDTYTLGSCTLNATTIDASKVAQKVPQLCLGQLPLTAGVKGP